MLLHSWNKYKIIFAKVLKDVGIEVPKSIGARLKYSVQQT